MARQLLRMQSDCEPFRSSFIPDYRVHDGQRWIEWKVSSHLETRFYVDTAGSCLGLGLVATVLVSVDESESSNVSSQEIADSPPFCT